MKTQLFFSQILFLLIFSVGLHAQQISMGFSGSNDVLKAGVAHPSGGYGAIGVNQVSGNLQFLSFSNDLFSDAKLEYRMTDRKFSASDIQPAPDAIIGSTAYTPGYFIAGNVNMTGGSKRMFVMRVGQSGTIAWSKYMSSTVDYGARALVTTPEKNVVFVGVKNTGKIVLHCFNPAGSTVWGPYEYSHPSITLDPYSATLEVLGNRLIVTGAGTRTGENSRIMTFAVNAANGTPLWLTMHRTNATHYNIGMDIASQTYGSSRVAVVGYAFAGSNIDPTFLRIDPSTGVGFSGKTYTQTSATNDDFKSICADEYGTWAVTGRAHPDKSSFVKLSSSGVPSLGRAFPDAYANTFSNQSISRKPGGGYFMTAQKTGLDYHFMWLNGGGETACANSEVLTFTYASAFTSTIEGVPASSSSSLYWYNLSLSAVPIDGMSKNWVYNGFSIAPWTSPEVISPCTPGPMTIAPNPIGGMPPYYYQWSTGQLSSTIVVNPSETTIYGCDVFDATGCSIGASYQATVYNSNTLPQNVSVYGATANSFWVTAQTESAFTGYWISLENMTTGGYYVVYTPTLPYRFTGLSCNTMYAVHVRPEMCGVNADQAGAMIFTTPCLDGAGEDRMAESETTNENKSELTANAYPNPTQNAVTVNWENTGNIREIHVISTDGKRLHTFQTSPEQTQLEIDISNQSAGLYFVQLVYNNGQMETLRVNKQ